MGVSFEIGLFDYHLLLILLQVGKNANMETSPCSKVFT